MTDTKELLARIAALRTRLNASAGTDGTQEPLRRVEENVQRGAAHNLLLENALRSADVGRVNSVPTSLRLTARGARLLRQGRELLQELRAIANEPRFQEADEKDAVVLWHHEAMAMLEVLLRTVQAMPASVSGQLRMCEGLEVVVAEVEERINWVRRSLVQRTGIAARIDELADFLRALASRQAVGLTFLQSLADRILEEAHAGLALQFLYSVPTDPSRFAAAHSLNVAQVLARLPLGVELQSQAQLAVMAALVHDVGMTRVPAEVLIMEGPLESDERRLIEKHTVVAEGMLAQLWPGGGWPIEAATGHHERNDGTGYPLGRQGIEIAPQVQLLAVCDVYAALCAPRPHRPAFDTRAALTEILLLAERDFLHKASAERLLVLSFYPVGSIVELNDGGLGVVIATHTDEAGLAHADRPLIHVIADAHGQPAAWPLVVDLLESNDRRILRALRPDERQAAVAKRYPHLI